MKQDQPQPVYYAGGVGDAIRRTLWGAGRFAGKVLLVWALLVFIGALLPSPVLQLVFTVTILAVIAFGVLALLGIIR